tara:strand:+ start:2106 stop:2369 length:264 start_codon:yes stop_codon:yes gene_type:complete
MKKFVAKKIYAGLYVYRGLVIRRFEYEGYPVYWSIGDTVDAYGNRRNPEDNTDYFNVTFNDSANTFAEAKYLVDDIYFNDKGERRNY